MPLSLRERRHFVQDPQCVGMIHLAFCQECALLDSMGRPPSSPRGALWTRSRPHSLPLANLYSSTDPLFIYRPPTRPSSAYCILRVIHTHLALTSAVHTHLHHVCSINSSANDMSIPPIALHHA